VEAEAELRDREPNFDNLRRVNRLAVRAAPDQALPGCRLRVPLDRKNADVCLIFCERPGSSIRPPGGAPVWTVVWNHWMMTNNAPDAPDSRQATFVLRPVSGLDGMMGNRPAWHA
jgi:hypothetical protein